MTHPLRLLGMIDKMNDQIRTLESQKISVYQKLGEYKREIEKQNSHLIGRKAICVNIYNPKPVECICTAVLALDDYESVKPLFSRNGKKYIVETYDWVL